MILGANYFLYRSDFYARQHAIARRVYAISRQSVRLWHGWISRKRLSEIIYIQEFWLDPPGVKQGWGGENKLPSSFVSQYLENGKI